MTGVQTCALPIYKRSRVRSVDPDKVFQLPGYFSLERDPSLSDHLGGKAFQAHVLQHVDLAFWN